MSDVDERIALHSHRNYRDGAYKLQVGGRSDPWWMFKDRYRFFHISVPSSGILEEFTQFQSDIELWRTQAVDVAV